MGKTYDYPTAYALEPSPEGRSFGHNLAKGMKHAHEIAKSAAGIYTVYADTVEAQASKKIKTESGSNSVTKPAVVIDATRKAAGGGSSVKPGTATARTPAGNTSYVNGPAPSIGAGASQVLGNQWSPTIKIKLGKQERPSNPFIKMLQSCQGSGTVTTTFGGYMTCPNDKRTRVYHSFRHRLHKTSHEDVNGPYPLPSSRFNHILSPSNTISPELGAYSDNPSESISMIAQLDLQPFQNMQDAYQYSCPLNVGDYEDMSWNLNSFKLGWDSSSSLPAFKANAPTLQENSHRAVSEIYLNNIKNVSLNPANVVSPNPFKYNMCFNRGVVNYTFMNKGESPLEVEVIVYKVKKNQMIIGAMPGNVDFEQLLEDPIKLGYHKSQADRLGTDRLNGRESVLMDCVTNPRFPFLPQTKKTLQSTIPFKEVERVRVTLQCGERRPVVLELGGEIYDPANKPLKGKPYAEGSGTSLHTPQMDDSCFVIAIGLNGQLTSRSINGKPQAGLINSKSPLAARQFLLGDMYGSANLQFYGSYEETLSACIYKGGNNKKIFVQGGLTDLSDSIAAYNGQPSLPDGQKITTEPVVLVPQSAAVRVGPKTVFQDMTDNKAVQTETPSNVLTSGAQVQMDIVA